MVNFGNHPTVLVRGNNSVLPRLGGGVPAKVVLASSGIKRGPLVKVSGWDADAKRREKEAQEKLEAAKREAAKRAEEKRRAERADLLASGLLDELNINTHLENEE